MFELIARPFGVLLLLLYKLCGNYGVAVILFAVVVKLILLPFQMKAKRSSMKQTRLQPKIKELEKRYSGDKAKVGAETLKLYKDEDVNMAGGCLWNLIPFPIMIALFQAIRNPLTTMMGVVGEQLEAVAQKLTDLGFIPTMSASYMQVEQVQFITEHFEEFAPLSQNIIPFDFSFLGLNLGLQPVWNYPLTADWSQPGTMQGFMLFLLPIICAILSVVTMIVQQKINPTFTKDQQNGNNMLTMLMMGPVISLWFGFSMPAAMSLYILFSSTIFQFFQDIILTKHYTKILDAEDSVRNTIRREKENAEERARQASAVSNPNTSKKRQQIAEKQERLAKQAEWEKKNSPVAAEPEEPSRIGQRKYARGRAYDPNRYSTSEYLPEEKNSENVPVTSDEVIDVNEDEKSGTGGVTGGE